MQGITASCVIRDRVVRKDGEIVFENSEAGLSEFLLSLYQHLGLNYPRFYKMDPLSKLGWLAAEVLLKDNFGAEDYRPEQVGLVLSNANSSLDTDIRYFESVKDIPSPSLFVYTLPNIMIGEIGIRHNFKGESAFFISERYEAGFIESYVRDLLDDHSLEACIYGWVDLLGEKGEAILFLVEKENK
jgi:hypothetical protein